ncbi:hypothetical protein [Bacillus thuringiensis]
MDDCRIGKRKVKRKWDHICQQAFELGNKGYTYKKTAYQLGCHVSGLRKQLNQRGL